MTLTALPEIQECPAAPSIALLRVAGDLAELLDAAVALWEWRETEWVCLDEAESLAGIPPDESGRFREPSVTPLSPSEFLAAVPLKIGGRFRGAATAVVRTEEPGSLQRQLGLFCRWLQESQCRLSLEKEVDSFVVQLTDDLEELTFLRTMAQHLEVSTLLGKKWKLADAILPQLRSASKAETVALLIDERDRGGDIQVTSCSSVWGRELDKATGRELIDLYGEQVTAGHVVKNRGAGPIVSGVHDLVLVRVAKGNRHYGWLAAINRLQREESGAREVAPFDRSHEHQGFAAEFGTIEAGLLASTATMLAVQSVNVELLEAKEKLLLDIVRALVAALDARDPYTCGHSERVAGYAAALASRLGLDSKEGERIYLTGLLHDIGKIGISDAVLRKPGRLTDEEFREIKKHPDMGWAILHQLDDMRFVFEGIVFHHERPDGKGYPDGLTGDEVPLIGRILAVADAYDAMTSDRPYRKGMPHDRARTILLNGSGKQWDSQVIAAFLRAEHDILRISEQYRAGKTPRRRRGTIDKIVDSTERRRSLRPLPR